MKKTPGEIIILRKCTINAWDMKCTTQNFFGILSHFLPFYLGHFLTFFQAVSLKTENFFKKWKKKKTPGDIIILHNCAKNHDHRLYCSWDMAHDRYNCYFSFWAIFFPFTPLTVQKLKNSKKWKKTLEISSFNTGVPKIMIICFTVPEIWHVTDVTIFNFGLFFALPP